MNAKIIYLGQRSITLELQNDLPYYNDSLYDIYLMVNYIKKKDKLMLFQYMIYFLKQNILLKLEPKRNPQVLNLKQNQNMLHWM